MLSRPLPGLSSTAIPSLPSRGSMVGSAGLEPATSCLYGSTSRRISNFAGSDTRYHELRFAPVFMRVFCNVLDALIVDRCDPRILCGSAGIRYTNFSAS